MMDSRRVSLVFLLITTVALTAGCDRVTDDEGNTGGPNSLVLGDHAVVIDGSSYSVIGIVGTTWTIGGSAASGIVAGDLLIGADGGGFIRRVTGVVLDGGVAACETEAANLAEAVMRGVCTDTMAITLDGLDGEADFGRWLGGEVTYTASGVSLGASGLEIGNVLLADENVEGTTVSATLNAATVDFSPELIFDLGFDVGILKLYTAVARGDLDFSADITVTTSDSLTWTSDPLRLYSVAHDYVVDFGPIPVYTRVTLDFYAGVDMALTTAADIDLAEAHADDIIAGARYVAPGWRTEWAADVESSFSSISWSNRHDGSMRCWIEPRLTVSHYGAGGPILQPQPWIGMNATDDGFWWQWDATTGWDFAVGWTDTVAVPALDPGVAPVDTLGGDDRDVLTSRSGMVHIGGLVFTSTPAGAEILIDDSPMGVVTPDTLDYIEPGLHELRLYREGYNEHVETIDYAGGFQTWDAVLTEPSWPRPVFTFTAPEDSAVFSDNVISVSGTVAIGDGVGGTTPFTGEKATMRLNGIDQTVAVDDGLFSLEASIFSGWNELQMRANSAGQTGTSEVLHLLGDFQPDDIVVQLSWDSPNSDMDLHVWSPSGQHCYWNNKTIAEGSLDIDEQWGYGPETFTATEALDGQYVVKVNAYAMHGDAASANAVTIWLNGGRQPTPFGPFTLSVDDTGGTNPEAWWDVNVFTMANGQKSLKIEPADPELIEKIRHDMENMPQK